MVGLFHCRVTVAELVWVRGVFWKLLVYDYIEIPPKDADARMRRRRRELALAPRGERAEDAAGRLLPLPL